MASDTPPGSEISWLAKELYAHCYVRPLPRSRSTSDAAAVHAFRLALSAANRGSGHWESGWRTHVTAAAERVDGSARQGVHRYGVEFVTTTDRVRADGPPPSVAVLVPKERRKGHPGYYVALGNAPWPAPGSGPMVRVYWNLRPIGAPAWVDAVTEHLNAVGEAFLAKLRDHPDGHGRADSAVLYLPGGIDKDALQALDAVYAAVADHLVAEEPMFARALAPGVGAATDPGLGLSFGQHQCELVARALRGHAESRGPDAADGRYEAIARQFREAGIDPSQPHCTADDAPQIEALRALGPPQGLAAAPADPVAGLPRNRPARDGGRLGDLLCGSAYWNEREGRCSWVGRRPDVTAYAHGRTPMAIAVSLDARLYDGDAGVAVFLAELSELTGSDRQLRTAVGAARSARRHLRAATSSGHAMAGLFTGACGVAWMARRLATLVESSADLADDMERLTIDAIRSPQDWPDDVVSGRAGVILTLLALERPDDRTRSANLTELAVDLGHVLVESLRTRRVLTGMAHGASGFAMSLLRLHARTGLDEFLEAGRAALAWEDALFDEVDGTWPDLRDLPDGTRGARGRAAVTWCNGAAGIAIARLAAASDDPARREPYLERARTALRATSAALAQLRPDDDASLCHGIAGLAETLLLGSEETGDPQLASEAREAMLAIASRGTWTGDAGAALVRADPGLMLGAAGIGHELLRLHATSAVSSVLAGPRR